MSNQELVNKIVMFRTELERQNAGMGTMSVFDSMCAYFGEQHREIERLREIIVENEIDDRPKPRFKMDVHGNLTRIED